MSKKKITICICMGSSCHSRGNFANLKIIQNFIDENKLDCEISLKGSLCQNECKKGPIIIVNEKPYYNVSPNAVREILAQNMEDC
ncbi:MAG: NAD(P)H-dependent oxidoreductase subunit E [Spirochaetales bacterium]|nr:NAD(P)H-dependent oxidoreductase subunit E [Spirochaetales bacterium]